MEHKDYKILIADDSLLARKKLKDCLSTLGYTNVLEAEDGQSAVDIYTKEFPDLVFMDIVMPHKFGIDALKEIMNINSSAKVVMLSTTGTKSNMAKSIKAGASDFLLKPYTKNQVSQILQHLNE